VSSPILQAFVKVQTQEADEVFQELKENLTLLPIMVALEPDKPLMLYIVTTAKVMSMVLVTERLVQLQPQALKGAPATCSRSQDPDPTGWPQDKEPSRS
jgi:hypothetical protein